MGRYFLNFLLLIIVIQTPTITTANYVIPLSTEEVFFLMKESWTIVWKPDNINQNILKTYQYLFPCYSLMKEWSKKVQGKNAWKVFYLQDYAMKLRSAPEQATLPSEKSYNPNTSEALDRYMTLKITEEKNGEKIDSFKQFFSNFANGLTPNEKEKVEQTVRCVFNGIRRSIGCDPELYENIRIEYLIANRFKYLLTLTNPTKAESLFNFMLQTLKPIGV
jgi:hypothetical protein